ncbi:CrcB-like protein-domain-containing protein [Bombardia bombarda]|uniref:CrcB-like protein-domain-containing protein n=1 Tax=Bombardia bombarda TaxID=252184 RepID=A0AA40CA18_9PEZI|nr:CrcB-like protein-domain-containing protein [Bombardia bombarda]
MSREVQGQLGDSSHSENDCHEDGSRYVSPATRPARADGHDYDVPDDYAALDELMGVSPIQNPEEDPVHTFSTLEETRSHEQEYIRSQRLQQQRQPASSVSREVTAATPLGKTRERVVVSRLATELYTISYLILFSIFGTLARLGLQALTSYPGMPVVFPSLWPNFGGSLVMGFLSEERMLFRHEWDNPAAKKDDSTQPPPRAGRPDEENGGSGTSSGGISSTSDPAANLAAAKKAHLAVKKTIPLYIGLATGFCGSFTSFSSFIRDMLLALSNDLTPTTTGPRNGGYSFLAVLAVLLITISLSLSALFLGAQIAIALESIAITRVSRPSLPSQTFRKTIDRLAVDEAWRGAATFAIVFAPLGCLLRFYASLRLNGRVARFPLGTFAVNMFGTAVLGMAWDLAHVSIGTSSVVSCQVLQGIEDGFCGCLTTVSTWVAELAALRRRHAYVYGAASVAVGLGLLVVIMGGLRWSGGGFGDLRCVHSL